MIVDVYAPRLLENLFETDDGEVSHHILQAIARSDAYLIAHEDQRDHWQALMRAMGVDDIDNRTNHSSRSRSLGNIYLDESPRLVEDVWLLWQNP